MLNQLRYFKSWLLKTLQVISGKIVYYQRSLLRIFHHDKNEKVFGIGMPKTGTTTLGSVMDILGYRHHTYDMNLTVKVKNGDLEAVRNRVKKYDSFEDWPWFLIYKELDAMYPNAKFILTRRISTEAYTRSLMKHHQRQEVNAPNFPKPDWWDGVFDFQPNEWNYEKAAIEYENHNKEVKAYFSHRPN